MATEPEQIVTLRDGSQVLVRPIKPDDKQALVEGLDRLSSESRYRWFLRPVTRLSERELRYLTEIDYRTKDGPVRMSRAFFHQPILLPHWQAHSLSSDVAAVSRPASSVIALQCLGCGT